MFIEMTHLSGLPCGEIMEAATVSVQSSDTDTVYAQADGCMILTREPDDDQNGSWQEVKLCRVYQSGNRLSSKKKHWIEHSGYIAHMGDHKP